MIERIIRLNRDFSKDYIVIHTPKVYDYLTDRKNILKAFVKDKQFLSKIDLFIYQSISKNNRFSEILNTEDLKTLLNNKCENVNILNLYFTGYFPQMKENEKNLGMDVHQSGFFPYGDKYVDQLIEGGMRDGEDILKILMDENFLSEDVIEDNVKESLKELSKREKVCDVKIVDYIECNYRKEQLFYSCNHPNETLLNEYVRRILEYLGYKEQYISEKDIIMRCESLKGQDIPIYPAVVKCLGLNKYEKTFYPNRYMYESFL